MQFTINRDILLKSLNYVQGIVEKKNTLPILSNVLLNLKNNKLEIIATDLDIVFYENNDNSKKLNYLKNKFSDKKSISVFIGPVGGFSIEEIEYFKCKESVIINLGNTIFKSDTASIISVALLRNLISGNLD